MVIRVMEGSIPQHIGSSQILMFIDNYSIPQSITRSNYRTVQVDYLISRMATLRQIRRDNGEETGGEEEDMAPPATPTEDSLSPFFSLTDGGTVH